MPTAAPPVSTRASYHHGDLRRALMDAALALIAEEQGWSFSLREVARRAGVSHNAPSRHFADKRDLLGALAVTGYETLAIRMQECSTGDAARALVAIGTVYVEFATTNPAQYRLMFGPELRGKDGALPVIVEDAAEKAKALLADVIHRGAGAGDFRLSPNDQLASSMAVLSAWAIVHGLSMLINDGMTGDLPLSTELIAERVTLVLLNGLQPK